MAVVNKSNWNSCMRAGAAALMQQLTSCWSKLPPCNGSPLPMSVVACRQCSRPPSLAAWGCSHATAASALRQQPVPRHMADPPWPALGPGEQAFEYLPAALDQPTDENMVPKEDQLLLQVAVVGAPNAGKSTLTNALVGTKVSAVSPKTNTTSVPMLGAWTEGRQQVVLFDTPGVVSPKQYLSMGVERRVKSAWTTAGDCDLVLFMLDAERQIRQNDPRVTRLVRDLDRSLKEMSDAQAQPPPAILVMNKVDLLKRQGKDQVQVAALKLCEQLNAMHSFEQTFWVSALRGVGIPKLKEHLMSRCTPGEWDLRPNEWTDRSPMQIAREVVREQIFLKMQKEFPYQTSVVPVEFKQLADGAYRIEQNLLVSTPSRKRMLVGTNGCVIGAIGVSARQKLMTMFNREVHLFLHVVVRDT